MKRYNGIIEEILYYSEKTEDGRWIIPIEVDFDYTLTKCSSWALGEMVINDEAFEVMKRWANDYNVGWILNTMRHDEILKEPLRILNDNGIELYGVRKNPLQENDENKEVTKTFAIMSIDDRNVGIPHKWYKECDRPYVDWKKVNKIISPILKYISDELKKY